MKLKVLLTAIAFLVGGAIFFLSGEVIADRKDPCKKNKSRYRCEKQKKKCKWVRSCKVCVSKKVSDKKACEKHFIEDYYYSTILAAGRCRYSDCLKNGWETRHPNGRYSTSYCRYSNCLKNGWETKHPNGQYSKTYCRYSNCLKNGWETKHPNGRYSKTYCRYSNCLKNGWETRHPNGRYSKASCKYSDCKTKGWSLSLPSGKTIRCSCRRSDCFKYGVSCY